MSDYVYLIYDTKDDLNDHRNINIVAVVDNDKDFLHFLMLHQAEYPLCKDSNKTYDDIREEKIDVLKVQEYFENIYVDRLRVNVDYGMKLGLYGRMIDHLAEEKGIDHLGEIA